MLKRNVTWTFLWYTGLSMALGYIFGNFVYHLSVFNQPAFKYQLNKLLIVKSKYDTQKNSTLEIIPKLEVLSAERQKALRLVDKERWRSQISDEHSKHPSEQMTASGYALQLRTIVRVAVVVVASQLEGYTKWWSLQHDVTDSGRLCPFKPIFFIHGANEAQILELKTAGNRKDVVLLDDLEERKEGFESGDLIDYLPTVLEYFHSDSQRDDEEPHQTSFRSVWFGVFSEKVFVNCSSFYAALKFHDMKQSGGEAFVTLNTECVASRNIDNDKKKESRGYIFSNSYAELCRKKDCSTLKKIGDLQLSVICLNEATESIINNIGDADIVYPVSLSTILEFARNNTLKNLAVINDLTTTISTSAKIMNTSDEFNLWPAGYLNTPCPKDRLDVLVWDVFNSSHLISINDMDSTTNADDFKNEIETVVEQCRSQMPSLGIRHFLVYGYRRFDPVRGLDYRLFFMVASSQSDDEEKLQDSNFGILLGCQALRPLLSPHIVNFAPTINRIYNPPHSDEVSSPIWTTVIILPCTSSAFVLKQCRQFIIRYAQNYPGSNYSPVTKLFVAIEKSSNQSEISLGHLITAIKSIDVVIKYRLIESNSEETLTSDQLISKTLYHYQDRFMKSNTMILVVPPNQLFSKAFLKQAFLQVTTSTALTRRIYSPIPYQLYRGDTGAVSTLHPKRGRFDSNNRSILSFLFSDWLEMSKIRKNLMFSDELFTQFSNWSRHASVLSGRVEVFRSLEPTCVLFFSASQLCGDALLENRPECVQFLGSQKKLALEVWNNWHRLTEDDRVGPPIKIVDTD